MLENSDPPRYWTKILFLRWLLVAYIVRTVVGKSTSIQLAAFQAQGGARMRLSLPGTVNILNVEHRTPNIERPMLMTLRFIYFKTSESCWRRDLKIVEYWTAACDELPSTCSGPESVKGSQIEFQRVDSLAQRRRCVLLSLFYKLTVRPKCSQQAEFIIRCWTFNVRCSMFIFS